VKARHREWKHERAREGPLAFIDGLDSGAGFACRRAAATSSHETNASSGDRGAQPDPGCSMVPRLLGATTGQQEPPKPTETSWDTVPVESGSKSDLLRPTELPRNATPS
jgi:hypothetical protein